MRYSKKDLVTLLKDNNITTTAKSIIELMLLALDNEILSREDVVSPKKEPKRREPKESKPRGRPSKYPPKEVDPNKVVDPKYHRLRTIRTNPISIKLTNLDTGEVTKYGSLYKASLATKHGCGFFARNIGKVVDGLLIDVIE